MINAELSLRHVLVVALLLFVASFQGNAQTTLRSNEISSTGGSAQSTNFSLSSSIGGQASPTGSAFGGAFAVFNGYTFTTVDEVVVVNAPPQVSHTQIPTPAANQPVTITADISEDVGLESVTLNFRRGGETTFSSTAMSAQAGITFQGTIPANFVGNRGLEYFIEATDVGGLSALAGTFFVSVALADPGIMRGQAQPSGNAQNAYRLVSIPLNASNKSVNAILFDDLGQYDDTEWRFFELRANQQYSEFPGTSGMIPGKAFWLIVRQSGRVIDTGAGQTELTDEPFSINLNSGWNFIGNPFNFPIPLSNVSLESGGDLDIRFFTGSEFINFTGSLRPFDGYAVFSNGADQLNIDPELTAAPKPMAQQSTAEWQIAISAAIQQARDTQNFVRIISDASQTWDRYDRPEAPVIGEYVQVYFPHPEWSQTAAWYATDARPEPQDGDQWEFHVRSNLRDHLTLSFTNMELVPAQFQVWLVDQDLKVSRNLRETRFYSVAHSGDETQARRFQLVLGKDSFVNAEFEQLGILPTSFELDQNFPNPFNPTTTIRYGVPVEAEVTIKIFNLLGSEVATLVRGERKSAGYHLVAWDGRDQFGRPVASGLYVYRLTAGGISETKKMALLK